MSDRIFFFFKTHNGIEWIVDRCQIFDGILMNMERFFFQTLVALVNTELLWDI